MKAAGLKQWLWNGIRITMGFLFLLAASGKFRDPVKFMGGMDEYGIVHGWAIPLGAVILPGVEWLGALCLLLAWRTRAAALLVSGMLFLFIFAMASAMHRHLELDCSCFDLMGADPVLTAHGPYVQDAVLSVLTLAFLFLSTEPSHVERPWFWRGLLGAALFAWTSFVLLDAGNPDWRRPLTLVLEASAVLWLVFDVVARGATTFRWGAVLRDVLLLGPLLFVIFHVLGDGAAMLGWSTIARDLSMALPALALAFYGPAAR